MGAIANRRASSEFGTTFLIRSDATQAKPSKLAENYFRSPFNCRRRVRVLKSKMANGTWQMAQRGGKEMFERQKCEPEFP